MPKQLQYVTAEEFVRVWQQSNSGAEVADALNLTRQAVHARAEYMRKRGVRLKRFSKAGNMRIDADKLNAIIDSES